MSGELSLVYILCLSGGRHTDIRPTAAPSTFTAHQLVTLVRAGNVHIHPNPDFPINFSYPSSTPFVGSITQGTHFFPFHFGSEG